MKIIVLGAGRVGSTVAQNLALENNDVTVVDLDAGVLSDMQNRLDLRTVQGGATQPDALRQAGAEDADLLVATTSSDEVNIVACQIAHTLFRTPRKIARIRSVPLSAEKQLFNRDHMPIDRIISPEQLVTAHFSRLVELPGALQVLDFANGRVRLVALRMSPLSPLVGRALNKLPVLIEDFEVRVAAIYRDNRGIIPNGDTQINAGDEVFFLTAAENAPNLVRAMRQAERPCHRVMIAGGGNIGAALAQVLAPDHSVKVLERDPKRVQMLADTLPGRVLVLQGEASDTALLQEECIEDIDVFCAVTNDDAANILSGLLAKNLGARKVLALVGRADYADLLPGSGIDVAVSPSLITTGALLTHIRRGDVVAVHSLRRGAAETIEAIAHGDESNSKVVGRRLDEIDLPADTSIGCVVREEQVLIAHHDLVIEADDHLVLFVTDKKHIPRIESLFQVGITFI